MQVLPAQRAGAAAVSEQSDQVAAASPFDQQAASETPVPRHGWGDRPKRRRGRWIAATVVVVVLAGGGAAVYVEKPFKSASASSAANTQSADPTGLQSVITASLSETTQASGTLGYAGNYTVVVPTAGSSSSGSGSQVPSGSGSQPQPSPAPSEGSSGGTFTALPAVGQTVSQGQGIYSVSGLPVPLLYGSVPAYRTLSQGMTGTDVKQLNADLVSLGYANSSELDPSSDEFSSATATALDKFQSHYGLTETGALPLGQAVFEPTALLVSSVSATLGTAVQSGAPVLQSTSTVRQVVAQVDANEEADVAPGAKVSIVLPNSQTTPGVVTSISTTANAPPSSSSSPSNGSGNSGSSSGSGSSQDTLDVDIKMTDPSAAGSIQQAPVEVNITTQSVRNVLAVPIDALITVPGGFDVEVAGSHDSRHLVPVTLGLMDDTAGEVQVSGKGLAAGQQVVVPRL